MDRIEWTGLSVLCRRNIVAIKWGYNALTLIYYLSALGGQTPRRTLENRRARLILAQLYDEMHTVVTRVVAKWSIDTTGSSTWMSFNMIWSVLPWPNWAFRLWLLLGCDFGVGLDRRSPVEMDLKAHKKTNFGDEFADLFDMAEAYGMPLDGFTKLRQHLVKYDKALDWDDLYRDIQPSAHSRLPARTLLLKCLLTFLATLVMVWWFVIRVG